MYTEHRTAAMAEPTEAEINSVCEMLEARDTRDRQMLSRALKVRIS